MSTQTDNKVEALSYLPETTQYAFTPADGNTYLIHYNDVQVVFPVISGAQRQRGRRDGRLGYLHRRIDEVDPARGAPAIPVNLNSFEINGELYTITGTPVGADYSSCKVVGDATAAASIHRPNTFKLERSRRHLHAAS